MDNIFKIKKDHIYIHGCYIPPDRDTGDDAIAVTLQNVKTGETNLHIVPNPMVEFFVTKPKFRNHKFKKESAPITELNRYTCRYKDIKKKLAFALGVPATQRYIRFKDLLDSPYVYGADLDALAQLKIAYTDAETTPLRNINIGIFDIEVSIETNEIINLAYCDGHTHHVHVTALKRYMKEHTIKDLEKIRDEKMKEMYDNLNTSAKKIWDSKPYTMSFHIAENEEELLRYSFSYIKECRPDFLGAWNGDYDIGEIEKRCDFLNIDVKELYSPDKLPDKFKFYKYRKDTRPNPEHFTDRFHWLDASALFQMFDPMCLLSRLRKAKGREPSYTLEYWGQKFTGSGKVKHGDHDNHRDMQANHFDYYTVYCGGDTIVPHLLVQIFDAINALIALSGPSLMSLFAKQTMQVGTRAYTFLRKKGYVSAAVGNSMALPEDKYIGNIGGAVLDTLAMQPIGFKAIKEIDKETSLHLLTFDMDYKAYYPSTIEALNISKDSKCYTVLWMEGCPYTFADLDILEERTEGKTEGRAFDVWRDALKENAEYIFDTFSLALAPDENAVPLGAKIFNLPNYTTMLKRYQN